MPIGNAKSQKLIGGRYQLGRQVLKGDPSRGIPALWEAQDVGDVYYLKLWKRQGEQSSDIQAFWNREVRTLMRLQGYPGAANLFVRVFDLNSDDKHFYAVLDGGQRGPLSEALADRARHVWLQNLSESARRRVLWEGVLRIAEALAILHSEGTLHRALTPTAIFVGPGGGGDFRLSGFEWSFRVASQESAASTVGRRRAHSAPELNRAQAEYSTATDWFDVGIILAELFGIQVGNFKTRDAIRHEVAKHPHLRRTEKNLILDLIQEDFEQRLSTSLEVINSIGDVISDLTQIVKGPARSLLFGVRLGAERSISRLVEEVSEGTAPSSQPTLQRQWIENDLRGDIRITARLHPKPCYVLRGAKLEYRIIPWSQDTVTTWAIGYCDAIFSVPRQAQQDDRNDSLGDRKLEVKLYPEVRKAFLSIQNRSAAWDKVFPLRRVPRTLEAGLRDVFDFFRVTQQLDTALVVAQIFPVEILAVEVSGDETEIVVTPWEEIDRNTLAQHLELPPPSEQLADWFRLGAEPVVTDEEDDPKRDSYRLLDRHTIDSDGSEADWKFVDARHHSGGPRYRFRRVRGTAPVAKGRLYLARNHAGTVAQIRRRNKAIEDLRQREDLLRLFADPRAVSRSNANPLPIQIHDVQVDKSKIEALTRLWNLQPSFALQGPPGTGKTTLIQSFIDRLMGSDRSAQVLITAHSHHTVDDVRTKLNKMFAKDDERSRPIMVRLGAREPTIDDPGPVTERIIRRLQNSELARGAPNGLKAKLQRLPLGSALDPEVRALQNLVQDAANVVFATANSGELEGLALRGRRFDWSLIEEAGKAHGFDLAMALQASHRLLLIGDHFQLPPFNARLFQKLLSDSLRVKRTLETAARFAPGLIDRQLPNEEEDRTPFAERCARWYAMISVFRHLFEHSIGDSETPGPAATLTEQYRMHPQIAQIVGKIFYPSNNSAGTILMSPEKTYEDFSIPPPFAIKPGSWLGAHPVTWVNIPWVQRTEFSEGEVEGLFRSEVEARVVIDVLDQFRCNGTMPCEIQVLSPYRDQLEAIESHIEQARDRGQLAAIFEPPFCLAQNKRSGATVDEFQGSEADIVVISLVRNNALQPWKSIGFLKEQTRMNVLLSRAKHKLIIVGSWQFFCTRCDDLTPEDAEYIYLKKMMNVLREAIKSGSLERVDFR